MTDKRINVDRTVPVTREEYDRMADQRDEFRKLAYRLKGALSSARSALADARDALRRIQNEGAVDDDCYLPDDVSDAETAEEDAARALDGCPKLTG